ncbi:MAG: lipase [Blastopirellula sp.]|nr:MAG: lipase [Blastopirellula sp.]
MRPSLIALVVILVAAELTCSAVAMGDDFQRFDNIEYAEIDGHRLLLDLYVPKDVKNPPLVVWVHGGAWRAGSKAKMSLMNLVKDGFAVASVDYRLSPVARFPAQVHDCKAAIRFLRAKASKYGINAELIGIAGSSAGGHLVALIGMTNGHQALEGNIGDHDDESSSVQAVVDYYGPTNFLTILHQSTPHGLSVRVPALKLLLGDVPDKLPDLARLASPVFHVDDNDPPLLLIHGDQDPQVPINQSHEVHAKYKENNLPVQFEVVHGGAHGGESFFDTRRNTLVRDFFNKHLR